MSYNWFRFYADWLHNRKVRRLPARVQLHYVDLLCVKCAGKWSRNVRDLAWELGLKPSKFDRSWKLLCEAGLIVDGDIKGWDERQYDSDTSKERTRKWREKKRHGDVTPAVTVTPSDTDTDKNKNKKGIRMSEVAIAPADATRLATLLSMLILQNNPKAKIPKKLDKWVDAIDKIHRINGHSWAAIEAVIGWCQADDFWRCNIRSGGKLRAQFDQLLLQMQRKPVVRGKLGVEAHNKQVLRTVLGELKDGKIKPGDNGSSNDLCGNNGDREAARIPGGIGQLRVVRGSAGAGVEGLSSALQVDAKTERDH